MLNEISNEDIEEGEAGEAMRYIDDGITMERWARTHRQKVLRDISFESGSPFNIYNPRFSSDES